MICQKISSLKLIRNGNNTSRGNNTYTDGAAFQSQHTERSVTPLIFQLRGCIKASNNYKYDHFMK